MAHKHSAETIESLRLTLQNLQQTMDTDTDKVAMRDLKRILLNRIADLEVTMALESTDAEVTPVPDPAALIPPSVAEAKPPDEFTATSELAKLD